MLDQFDILPMDRSTAHLYAVTIRQLRAKSQLIGANDHWIAAAALAHAMPLVTNHSEHFSRIPGLLAVEH